MMSAQQPKNKTFSDIIPLLNDNEQKYLHAILTHTGLLITDDITAKASGDDALVLAVLNKQLHLAEELLKAGANVYAKVSNDNSLLAYAAEKGLDEVVSLLIRFGCNRFLADKREEALIKAHMFSRNTIMELLLKNQPYDPVKDHLLFETAAKMEISLLKRLMSLANHSEEQLTKALKGAALYNNIDTLNFLLEKMKNEYNLEKIVATIDISKSDEKTRAILSKYRQLQPEISHTCRIDDLSLPDVLHCLYQLAEKTPIGKQETQTLRVFQAYNPSSSGRPGDDSLILEIEVLADKKINITKYMKHFNLTKEEVVGAIEKLKANSNIDSNPSTEKSKKSSSPVNNLATAVQTGINKQAQPSNNYPSSFISTINNDAIKERETKQALKDKIENILCKLFATKCTFLSLRDNDHTIGFSTKITDDVLKKYASQLEDLGITVKAVPASTCMGFIEIGAKLELSQSTDVILNKLDQVKYRYLSF